MSVNKFSFLHFFPLDLYVFVRYHFVFNMFCVYLCFVYVSPQIKYWKKRGLRITFGSLYHQVLNQVFIKE